MRQEAKDRYGDYLSESRVRDILEKHGCVDPGFDGFADFLTDTTGGRTLLAYSTDALFDWLGY